LLSNIQQNIFERWRGPLSVAGPGRTFLRLSTGLSGSVVGMSSGASVVPRTARRCVAAAAAAGAGANDVRYAGESDDSGMQ